MRMVLTCGVVALMAACTPTPASEPAAPAAGVTLDQPAPMAPPQIALPVDLVGRWGITAEACAPTNDAKDGVIAITATTVDMGMDACTISSAAPEGAGTHLVAQCRSGEGEADYVRDFSFVSGSPDTMTWITEGGAPEPYVRCK